MLAYRERMKREASRLRDALARLDHTSGQHRAVPAGFVGVGHEFGAWRTVRCENLTKHRTLSRELERVLAKLGTYRERDSEVPLSDDELRAEHPGEATPPLADAAATLDYRATEAPRLGRQAQAGARPQQRDELVAEASDAIGNPSTSNAEPATERALATDERRAAIERGLHTYTALVSDSYLAAGDAFGSPGPTRATTCGSASGRLRRRRTRSLSASRSTGMAVPTSNWPGAEVATWRSPGWQRAGLNAGSMCGPATVGSWSR
jgi:hypothetical protein